MSIKEPAKQEGCFRVAINLEKPTDRMDLALLEVLNNQDENAELKKISKKGLKNLFEEKKIFIKGQRARAKSSLASGLTYVDIEGY